MGAHDDVAREILAHGSYVVLSTADEQGLPWASPVWYATESFSRLHWVSYPGARHSQNIAARPEVAMVVFDSTVAPGTGQAVYMAGTARQVTDPATVNEGMAVFSRKSERQGIGEWGPDRVTGDARLRLYVADVHEHWILDPDSAYDERVRVSP